MTVYVDVNGRRYTVDATRRDGAFLVSVDGRSRMVDVKEIAGVMSLLVGPPEDRGSGSQHESEGKTGVSRPTRSYDVSINGDTVHVNGVPIQFSIVHPAWAGHARAHAAHADGPQQVTAPMPGKIVRLLVKPGDRVQARQGLVVVEAMKMENELRARAAGTVADVRAIEGMTVEAGAILIVLE